MAATGPIPITSGGTPPTANERNLSKGFNPSASACSLSIRKTDAAPSLVCEEFPAVTDPLTEKAGRSFPNTSAVVPGRTPSS